MRALLTSKKSLIFGLRLRFIYCKLCSYVLTVLSNLFELFQ